MKLSDAIQGFWLDKQLDFSPHTVESYDRTFGRLIGFLGDVEFGDVSSDDIRAFLQHLRTEYNLSRRSIHDAWIPLSSLWTWAEKELDATHVIRGKIDKPAFTKRVIEPFTAEELRRMVRVAAYKRSYATKTGKRVRGKRDTGDRDRSIILTLTDTGLRASELCALTLADYNAARARLHVQHGKGDKERFVVLGSRAQKELWRYLTGRIDAKSRDPLFATRTGKHMRRDTLRHLLNGIGKRANVPNVHPHRFRHTFAIEFLRNGGNIYILKELLGHEALDTVTEYARIAEQDIQAGRSQSPVDNWRI